MTGALEGKVAIVTGGGWNVGRAIALRFGREGAKVAIAGRTQGRLEETLGELKALGADALALPTDVTQLGEVDALVQAVTDRWGRIDALAAIAGGGGGYEPIDAIDPNWWEQVIRLNLVGTFHSVRSVLPTMRAQGSGSILTCGGGGAYFPMEGIAATAYASAKAGLCRLTDQLALELLPTGVRVNCIQPELTWSPDRQRQVEEEERRSGQPHPERAVNHSPEEAAELATWLASDVSRPLTGRSVSVNDSWWRDPEQVAAIAQSLHAYTLRRVDASGCVPR